MSIPQCDKCRMSMHLWDIFEREIDVEKCLFVLFIREYMNLHEYSLYSLFMERKKKIFLKKYKNIKLAGVN